MPSFAGCMSKADVISPAERAGLEADLAAVQGLQAQLEADLAALESELDRTRARANRMAAALAAVEAHEAGDDGGSPSDGETGGSEDSYVSGNGGNGRGAGA